MHFVLIGQNNCSAPSSRRRRHSSAPQLMGSSPALSKKEKKKAIPIGMTFSFLVAEAGLEPTTSGL